MGSPVIPISKGNKRARQSRAQLKAVEPQVLVGLIMGSQSDWETMSHAADTLEALGIPYEAQVVSAHRTPDLLFHYSETAQARGLKVIIAGAGGAAHLPGMCASKTLLPVLGVPVESRTLSGIDSLLSIVQMPAGIPVGTMAIGRAGATNAALLAAAMIAQWDSSVAAALQQFRMNQTERIQTIGDPRLIKSSSRLRAAKKPSGQSSTRQLNPRAMERREPKGRPSRSGSPGATGRSNKKKPRGEPR